MNMRLPARLLLTGAAGFVLASCVSDRPVAPVGMPNVSGNPVLRALAVAQTIDVVIPAAGGKISLFGAYELDFPANAVCDPNAADTQQGYAAAAWDAPCTPASGDVAITATAKWTNGRLYVDFQPALRFVPSKNVTLSTGVLADQVQYLASAGARSGWAISYAPGIESEPINDVYADKSLQTVIDGRSGKIWRRIKHFSGYMIAANGELIACDPNDGDPRCVWYEDGAT